MKLVELDATEEILDKIKKYLMNYEEHSTWEEHVNSCEMGGCQYTAYAITKAFPETTGIFGEIEVDEEYIDEDGTMQNLVTHHWIEIDGYPYDFAKGTLNDHINWHDLYDVELGEDDWRYHPIYKRLD
tara:strand:+ start:2268 stop:2651 length:384 start_codon:yes stop_codon:yes gene_type:complete